MSRKKNVLKDLQSWRSSRFFHTLFPRQGNAQPVIFCTVFTASLDRLSLVLRSIRRSHAVARLAGDALPGLSKERLPAALFRRALLPQPQEVEVLPGLLGCSCHVGKSCEAGGNEGPQEFKIVESAQPLLMIVRTSQIFSNSDVLFCSSF